MIVLKFGGTSVSSKKNIERIKLILSQKEENYILIVSAFSGMTNLLESISENVLTTEVLPLIEKFKTAHFSMIQEIFSLQNQTEILVEVQQKCNELESICNAIHKLNELTPRTKAKILSFGEQLTSIIIYNYLIAQQVNIELLDSRKLIIANDDYLSATVDFKLTNKNIINTIKNKNYIAGGFIASNTLHETVTLGRGGSDYTASIFASAIDAKVLEIWSDVSGMHSANPTFVKNTNVIEKLSYEEAFELAYFGAKVLYPPATLPVKEKKIALHLKNTFFPEKKGTLVTDETEPNGDKIKGISSINNIAIVTISGVGLAKQKGRARKVFQLLEEHDINVILITQSCSEQSIGIGIEQQEVNRAKEVLDNGFKDVIEKGFINSVKITKDQCIIAVVGENMKHHVGMAGRIFSAVGENGINITAIAQGASERNISMVINQTEEKKALNVIHEAFFSNVNKNVHLFIAGVGNVGGEFLKIIDSQKVALKNEHRINLKIIGLANSSRFLMDETNGLSFQDKDRINKEGKPYKSISDFTAVIRNLNLRNSVFIDNTASEEVSKVYDVLLKNTISVVTCNKIACSSNYEHYISLNQIAKDHHSHFKYETTVGAALPIIKTIHDLKISGDKVHKIEAVLSGSLNYIFNHYNGERNFSEVVYQALEAGYTEPNPLIDLSGLDVMRKILILTREAGYHKSISDITFKSFLPEVCNQAKNREILFEELKKNEEHFKSLYVNAQKKGTRLKVVASMIDGEMSVNLREIPTQSPFYNLEGKDNVVVLNTHRYPEEPLVIKGAGAGASVTASGVFADLMYIINR